jgi:hypothetical protein
MGASSPTFTTNDLGVNNSYALASRYLPILDEVYKADAKTSILDTANDRIRWIGANAVSLFKTTLNGLGNYRRNEGFVTGNATGSWENLTLTQDRGRGFLIDVMDNDETLGMALGTMGGEFTRLHVIPEVDAYRFAKIAGTAGIQQGTPVDLTAAANLPNLISEAEYMLSEAEVPEDGRILFVSENAYRYLRDQVTRLVTNDETGINHTIEYFDNMRVIRVPQARFYTGITLLDGVTGGQEVGGFEPASGAYPINFMVVHPSAVAQVIKHVSPRLFSPQQNITADAWLYQYRIVHDTFVLENKVNGIYLNRGATAV